MVLAFSIFTHSPNILVIILSGIIFLFLLKAITFKDKLWLASIVSVLLIAFIAIGQIVSYSNLMEKIQAKEEALENTKKEYAKLKSETESARSMFADAKGDVTLSRQELNDLRNKVTAEFDRTIREIRGVYANISDEELNRRFNNAVRKARQNLQNNVFQ